MNKWTVIGIYTDENDQPCAFHVVADDWQEAVRAARAMAGADFLFAGVVAGHVNVVGQAE